VFCKKKKKISHRSVLAYLVVDHSILLNRHVPKKLKAGKNGHKSTLTSLKTADSLVAGSW